MDLRKNPRVFRAWRVERLKNPASGQLISTGNDSKGTRNRPVQPTRRKGR